MADKDFSLDAFNRFMDHAASRGILKPNTAQSRKAATNKILGVLEQSEVTDLRNVDLDSAFDRFQNLQGMQYNPDSLRVYLSRARTAVSDFIAYVQNPVGFKSSTAQRSQAKKEVQEGGKTKKSNKKQEVSVNSNNPPDVEPKPRGLEIPVPLREDLTVRIQGIPADLTQAEAERLAAIVKAYAVPAAK